LCIFDEFADYFIGTKIGNDLKVEKELSAYDEDAKLTIDYLVGLESCNGKIGATGTSPFLSHISFLLSPFPQVE